MALSAVLTGSHSVAAQTGSSWISAIDAIRNKVAAQAFLWASYASDPIDNAHRSFREICVVDTLNPTSCILVNLAKKTALCIGIVGWISLAVFTSLPGVALRFLGRQLQTVPYFFEQGSSVGRVLPSDRSFSLLSWNICAIPGGLSISDGGVLHWRHRIDAVIAKIVEKNADVNCLYEVFDVQTAFYICDELKKRGYVDFCFNMEPKEIGISSGIFIASKYKIKDPQFTLFPQDALVGRTKLASKGVFQGNLESGGGIFASVFATHMQHSEEPEFPTDVEIAARKKQMHLIIDKVNQVRDRCVVVTGDWNLDDKEYNAASWRHLFQKGDAGIADKTWGGDGFCARLVGRRTSGPLNLDHTAVVRGSARSIVTSLVGTGFDHNDFKAAALSDHAGQLSTIAV